jgi:hypothetical protein
MKKAGNDATCITSVVLSRENVNYMKMAFKFDIEDIKNARMIMDNFNLLNLYISDETTQTINVLSDGANSFETLSYSVLDRELADREYKKMINVMHQMGR